jgi:hypothetical protein
MKLHNYDSIFLQHATPAKEIINRQKKTYIFLKYSKINSCSLFIFFIVLYVQANNCTAAAGYGFFKQPLSTAQIKMCIK